MLFRSELRRLPIISKNIINFFFLDKFRNGGGLSVVNEFLNWTPGRWTSIVICNIKSINNNIMIT